MRVLITGMCIFVAGLFCGTSIRYHSWRARNHRALLAPGTELKRRLADEKLHVRVTRSVPSTRIGCRNRHRRQALSPPVFTTAYKERSPPRSGKLRANKQFCNGKPTANNTRNATHRSCSGRTQNHEVAVATGTSEHVVKSRLLNVFDKTGMWNRAELAIWYERH
jgi:hypothetical protein